MLGGTRKRDHLGEREGDGRTITLYLRSRIRFVHWIDLAQDRKKWSLLLDTVMEFWVS